MYYIIYISNILGTQLSMVFIAKKNHFLAVNALKTKSLNRVFELPNNVGYVDCGIRPSIY
jgi:hypothetical protein